jgi:hypothetical protein
VHEQQHGSLAGGSVDDPITIDGDRTRFQQRPVRVHDLIISNAPLTSTPIEEITHSVRTSALRHLIFGSPFSTTRAGTQCLPKILAALLVIVFRGQPDRLIPLYAMVVFLSLTLSQTGMVRHWLRVRGPGWLVKAFANGAGALTC